MWKANFTQDTDIEGIGTLTLTNVDFTISSRTNIKDDREVQAFIDSAKNKFTLREAERLKTADFLIDIESRLNTAGEVL